MNLLKQSCSQINVQPAWVDKQKLLIEELLMLAACYAGLFSIQM